jgi:uncharacterized membrane protein YGL010W
VEAYAHQHRNRLNLLVHLLMVPQFMIACAGILVAIVLRHGGLVTLWLSVAALCVIGQEVGHLFEERRAEPARSFTEFVNTWFKEQFYVFPRFVLSGGWWRAFRGH